MRWMRFTTLLVVASLLLGVASTANAAEGDAALPFKVTLGVDRSDSPKDVAATLQILLFFALLSVLPAILLTMTSFTRVIIVLSFVRRAISMQQLPPNQVLVGLSLFMTLFIMAPVWQRVNSEAIEPYRNGEATQKQAFERGLEPFRQFMLKQARKNDVALFAGLARIPKPKTARDIPFHVLLPAFVTSELKTAFQMGFVIFLPFLVIDMVVSSVLTAMGMFMLPPIVVSVPFKILLFVLVDGWHLVIRSLATSFG